MGDADVAYRVVGDGPFDVLYFFGLGSHVDAPEWCADSHASDIRGPGCQVVSEGSVERLLHQVKRRTGTVAALGLRWLNDRSRDHPLERLRTQIGAAVGRQPVADVDELVLVSAVNPRPLEHGQ